MLRKHNGHKRYEVIYLYIVSLILFTFGLWSQEIVGFDARFYLFALEMWRHGMSFFPMTYHQFYPDYPASSTILIYLIANIVGGLNKWVAVFPSAAMAALTVTFTYLIGSLHSKRYGLFAVLYLMMTVTFLKSARSITLDFYPTMATVVSFYLVYSGDKEGKPYRFWYVFIFLLLGFIFRGPIGLIIPTSVVSIYFLLTKNFKRFFMMGIGSLFMLVLCTAILLWLANRTGGSSFMQAVLRMEILGRMDDSKIPFYFYLIRSMGDYAISFPIAFLVAMMVAYDAIKKRYLYDMKFLIILCAWVFIILIGMSIPGDKKIRYVLPMLPAVVLIAAYPFIYLPQDQKFLIWRKIMLGVFLLLPFIFLISTSILFFYAKYHQLNLSVHYAKTMLFFLILQTIQVFILYRYTHDMMRREVWISLVAAVSFICLQYQMIEPLSHYFDRARDFVQFVEVNRLHENAKLIFYKEKSDGLPIKYMAHMRVDDIPQYIDRPDDLLKVNFPAFIITSQSYFNALPDSIAKQFYFITQNKIGHVKVVVFRRKL